MNEITIPKRAVLLALVVAFLMVGGFWVAPILSKHNIHSSATFAAVTTTPPSDEASSQNAAVAGAQAFYTLDAQKGQQDWLNRLCAVSTQNGCAVYQNTIGPALWPSLEAAHTSTSVKVTVQGEVNGSLADVSGNPPARIWRLQIELSAPWPVQKTPQTVFSALALVVQEKGQWKFERFLSDEELSALSQK